ncbi:MAG: O-antigen ligase family protein [Acidobacteriota bacterium]
MGKKAKQRRGGRRGSERARSSRVDLTLLGLWLLVLLTPLVVLPGLSDSFRLPKQAVGELLALVSILCLGLRLGRRRRVEVRRLLRAPALQAALPLLLVATAGLLWTEHAGLVASRLPSLWIGAAALVAWSLATTVRERWLLLVATLVPATLLALVGIAQFHRLYLPFAFADPVTERLAVTSFAGGAFDLAAYLALPILFAQALIPRVHGARRWLLILALVLLVYCLFATQTLTALVAVVAGSAVLWLPRGLARFGWARSAAAALGLVVVVGGGVMAVEPLRERVVEKTTSLRTGDFDRLLTGRPDGWRAALHMAGENPLTGVGHGSFRAEFGAARLALRAQGVTFFRGQQNPFFVNAHSEPLEVAAELGLPGLAAFVWIVWLVGRALIGRRAGAEASTGEPVAEPGAADSDAASAPVGSFGAVFDDPGWRLRVSRAAWLAIVIMACFDFPFHLALLAFPWLLLTADTLAAPPRNDDAVEEPA